MLQYPKQQHVTLGSVENWGTNTNILRDPPKSIFTRRIDKVGQNMDITELVDSSGDRACEGINLYARGVNPMVSVSYNNQSNNAGISGNPTATSSRTQASLPYPAFEGGAFRPPVRTPRDLLPLSRLPRVWFAANALPSAPDYSKTKQQPNDYRAVKNTADMVHAYDIRPNNSANINVKTLEHFIADPKAAINDKHISISASAGIKSRDITSFTRENVDRGKGIIENILCVFAQSNKTQDLAQGLAGLTIDQKHYIQEYLAHEERTNPSYRVSQGLDGLTIDQKQYIQEYLAHEERTNPSYRTAQGLDGLSIDQKRYIQDYLAHEERTNPSYRTAQSLDGLTIDENKFIQDYLAHEERTNPSYSTAQGLDGLTIDQKRYIQDYLAHEGHTNLSMAFSQGLDNLSIDEKRYIQNILHTQAFANRSANINAKRLDEINDTKGRITVKDNMIQYNTESGHNPGYTFLGEMAEPVLDGLNLPQHSQRTQLSDSRIHHRVAHEKDPELERHTQATNVIANITKLEDINSMTISSRDARLIPSLQKGGFQNQGYRPSLERADLISIRESDKDRLRQSVNRQQFSRFE